jgi:hypothetical protein
METSNNQDTANVMGSRWIYDRVNDRLLIDSTLPEDERKICYSFGLYPGVAVILTRNEEPVAVRIDDPEAMLSSMLDFVRIQKQLQGTGQ